MQSLFIIMPKFLLSALLQDGLLIHLWKTKTKKYTGKIRQKSGLYKIEHLQDIQKGKFVEVKTFALDYTLGIAFIEYMIIYYSV